MFYNDKVLVANKTLIGVGEDPRNPWKKTLYFDGDLAVSTPNPGEEILHRATSSKVYKFFEYFYKVPQNRNIGDPAPSDDIKWTVGNSLWFLENQNIDTESLNYTGRWFFIDDNKNIRLVLRPDYIIDSDVDEIMEERACVIRKDQDFISSFGAIYRKGLDLYLYARLPLLLRLYTRLELKERLPIQAGTPFLTVFNPLTYCLYFNSPSCKVFMPIRLPEESLYYKASKYLSYSLYLGEQVSTTDKPTIFRKITISEFELIRQKQWERLALKGSVTPTIIGNIDD